MPVLAASSSPSDRTYSVAVGVILVFAALEILAIAIHFGAEYRAHRATLPPIKAPATAASVKPEATPAPPQASAPSSAALSASDHLLKIGKKSIHLFFAINDPDDDRQIH